MDSGHGCKFDDEFERQIRDIVERYPNHWAKMLKSRGSNGRYPDRTRLVEYIYDRTRFLDGKFHTFKTRVFCVLNRLTDFPVCANVADGLHKIFRKNVRNLKTGFGKYCCQECQHRDPGYFRKIWDVFSGKYGVVNPFQLKAVKERLAENRLEIQCSRDESKRRNNTFGKSKPEDGVYLMLVQKFGEENILRQFKSEKYPFNCDFYVKGVDLYIECNFNWTHGGHFFDENSSEDLKRLEIWKKKAETSKFYGNAVQTWTVRDVRKRETANMNGLRYLVFWNMDDAEVWFESSGKYGK